MRKVESCNYQWRSQGMAECGSCHTNLHKILIYQGEFLLSLYEQC